MAASLLIFANHQVIVAVAVLVACQVKLKLSGATDHCFE